MTVSGTSAFTLDFAEIIDRAYARVAGEDTTGYDQKAARINLQLLFQELQMRNVNLWTVVLDTQVLTQGDVDYTFGADVVDFLEMSVRDTSQSTLTDLPIERISRAEYEGITDKLTEGQPVKLFLDRQRDAPVGYIYQAPNSTTWTLRYWYIRRMYDVGVYTNTADVPVRWLPTIVSGLAYYVGRERRAKLGIEFVRELRDEYERDYGIAIAEDADGSAMRVQPDLSSYFGR
jgi:hypothetical protein